MSLRVPISSAALYGGILAAAVVVGSCFTECPPSGPCAEGRRIATIEVVPDSVTLTAVGDTVAFRIITRDHHGAVLRADSLKVRWISSDNAVAWVSPAGLASAVGSGSAEITASVEGVDMTPAAALRMVQVPASVGIQVQPQDAPSGTPLTTQPVLHIRDANRHLITGDDST